MTSRLTALGVLTCLVLATMTLTGPAANAAWGNAFQVHGGKLQVCKTPLGDGRTRVKIRLDNRNARHTHVGGITRIRGDQRTSRDVRAAAGRLSDVKSLIVKRGDELIAGYGETNGQGMGGEYPLSIAPRC